MFERFAVLRAGGHGVRKHPHRRMDELRWQPVVPKNLLQR